jgi:hypothetical protein
MWHDLLVAEEIRNTDLFGAIFFGVVAVLFAIKAEREKLATQAWDRMLKTAILICGVISIFLLVRIATLTWLFFVVLGEQ